MTDTGNTPACRPAPPMTAVGAGHRASSTSQRNDRRPGVPLYSATRETGKTLACAAKQECTRRQGRSRHGSGESVCRQHQGGSIPQRGTHGEEFAAAAARRNALFVCVGASCVLCCVRCAESPLPIALCLTPAPTPFFASCRAARSCACVCVYHIALLCVCVFVAFVFAFAQPPRCSLLPRLLAFCFLFVPGV